MNEKTRKIIDEIKEMKPALSSAELEKIISDLAANKPVVKADRRFRKRLREKIFGRKRTLRLLLRPQIIGAAAAAAAAVVIGAVALGGIGYRNGGIAITRAVKDQVAAASTGRAADDSQVSVNANTIPGEGDVFYGSGLNPEGPPGSEGWEAPKYMDLDNLVGKYEKKPEDGIILEQPANPKEVKLHFGYLSLTVKEPEKTREQITAFAEKLGGYAETAGADLVVIRVPQAAFNAALAEISTYGEVTDKSIETYDVTAEYQDLDLRLSTATAARDRLYLLLEKTTDVKERVKILKEIQRLTEQIEEIGRQLSSLDRLAAFAKISVTLQPRVQASGADGSAIPFAWIRNALNAGTARRTLLGSAKVEWPADFALLEKEKLAYAENPYGVSVAVYTEENTPRGDGNFWAAALVYHLQKRFAEATGMELGKFKAILFKSNDTDPFYLLIGVHAAGDRITVCKAVFPNKAQYDAQKAAVEKMISGMEVKP